MLEQIYEENKSHFSKSDYRIMDCLMRNQRDIQYLTTESLIKSTGASSSTISRFWGKIGFQNMKEFKLKLRAAEYSSPSERTSSAIRRWSQEKSHLETMKRQSESNIMKTLEMTDPKVVQEAAEIIKKAKKLYLFATDASVGLGEILAYRLRRLGIEFYRITPGSGIYETMMNLGARDAVVMFSYSRILSEIRVLLGHSEKVHYKTVLFTDLLVSPEVNCADAVLYSCRGELNEYHSMVAPMATVDLLIMELMENEQDAVEKARYLEQLREKYVDYISR